MTNPTFSGGGSSDDKYRLHLDMIRILTALFVFMWLTGALMGSPNNLVAHYVETTADGIPTKPVNLLNQRPEEELKAFAALAIREMFNLDSVSPYKSYRNTINRVNTHYYRLTWESLNITDKELDTGFISDGDQSYYLVGQELTAMLVRSGIIRMLTTDETKFWIEVKDSDFEVIGSRVCDPEFCKMPARQWDMKVVANLYMMKLENMSESKMLPMEVHVRLIAVSPMVSPKYELMVDRIATKMGRF